MHRLLQDGAGAILPKAFTSEVVAVERIRRSLSRRRLQPGMLEGSCVDRPMVYVCTAGLGILSDLILLVMPLPMILRLQMPRRQKAGLVVLFVIGSA